MDRDTLRQLRGDYLESQMRETSARGNEYGVLFLKNAFLVAGGGLFLTPALIQLVEQPNLEKAAFAGALFGACVLTALIGNYIIHINWTHHYRFWEIERNIFLDPQSAPDEAIEAKKADKAIKYTYAFTHLLAVTYFILFILACIELYLALGIGG